MKKQICSDMKKILFLLIVSIVANIFLNAQQPWQQFSDISTKEISGNFKSPPSEYGMILWWGWDGPMTDTVIKRDLDRIKAMGFRGVMVEAGYGMTAKYLSPEWFALVKIAVGEAKTRGMRVWIEDEGKYPSGFAGGKFSNERPDLKMQGLGVDAIWAQIWMDHVADYAKMASSASHLYGRPRSFTESFAAFTHRPSVPQAKWVLDYQLVRGINSVQIMFMSASTARTSPVAAPVNTSAGTPALAVRRTSFFMSDTFPPIAGYINRATYLLSQGRPASRIGVYFPTSSMMYGDNESNTSTLEISRQLMEQQQDFDFIDEQSLTSILNIGKGSMTNLSGQLYEAIIVPSVSVISKASLLKLQQFASSGGKVIFVGNLPALATDINFLKAVKPDDPGWAKQEPSGKITQGILNFLPAPDVKIDKSCPDIKYLHRKLKDAELYFLFNEGKEKQSLQVTLSGKGKPQVWDAMTGQVNKLHKIVYEKDAISVPLAFEPYETKFIIISK